MYQALGLSHPGTGNGYFQITGQSNPVYPGTQTTSDEIGRGRKIFRPLQGDFYGALSFFQSETLDHSISRTTSREKADKIVLPYLPGGQSLPQSPSGVGLAEKIDLTHSATWVRFPANKYKILPDYT